MRKSWVIFLTLYLIQFLQLMDFMSIAPLGALLIKSKVLSSYILGYVLSIYSVCAITGTGLAFRYKDKPIFVKTLVLLLIFFFSQLLLLFDCSNVGFLTSKALSGISGGLLGSFAYSQLGSIEDGKNMGLWNGRIQTVQAVITMIGIPLALLITENIGARAFFIFMSALTLIVFAIYFLTFRKNENSITVPAAPAPSKYTRMHLKIFVTGFLCYSSAFIFISYLPHYLINVHGLATNELNLAYVLSGLATILLAGTLGKFGEKISGSNGLLLTFVIISIVQMGFFADSLAIWLKILLPIYLVLSTSRMIFQRGLILESNKVQSLALHLLNNIAVRTGIMCAGILLSVLNQDFLKANFVAICVNIISFGVVCCFKILEARQVESKSSS